MESKVIEGLLEKYMEAETSLREEEILKSYFRSTEVAPHLEEYKPMFNFFDVAKEEHFTGGFAVEKEKKKVFSLIAVAASIVIIMGVVLKQQDQTDEFGTYEDPELALQKTREALQMVAMYMNDGTEDLEYLQEFNNTKNKIVKNP